VWQETVVEFLTVTTYRLRVERKRGKLLLMIKKVTSVGDEEEGTGVVEEKAEMTAFDDETGEGTAVNDGTKRGQILTESE